MTSANRGQNGHQEPVPSENLGTTLARKIPAQAGLDLGSASLSELYQLHRAWKLGATLALVVIGAGIALTTERRTADGA